MVNLVNQKVQKMLMLIEVIQQQRERCSVKESRQLGTALEALADSSFRRQMICEFHEDEVVIPKLRNSYPELSIRYGKLLMYLHFLFLL